MATKKVIRKKSVKADNKKYEEYSKTKVSPKIGNILDNFGSDQNKFVTVTVEGYNSKGNQELVDNKSWAKKTTGNLSVGTKFWIRYYDSGPCSGRIVNEKDGFFWTTKWTQVNEQKFNYYIQYLKTGNESYLTQADRVQNSL